MKYFNLNDYNGPMRLTRYVTLDNAAALSAASGETAGRVFENFVLLELFKHASWSEARVGLHHFRSQAGQEVDVVIDGSGGRVVGVEIKLSASPSSRDFCGLRALRAHLGDKLVRGVLIYTGREKVPFGDHLHALPASVLGGAPIS